jgi:predicted Zn-dependent peptidase
LPFCRHHRIVRSDSQAEGDTVQERFLVDELPNGLTLVAQPMETVSSAAMALAVPAGAALDPTGCEGSASVAVEWAMRGAGERDSRALNDALDFLGCRHSESVRSKHVHFSSALLGRDLDEVLSLYADIVLRPRLEDDTFEPCRALVLQDLASMEDEPMRKCTVLLQERFYPRPLGRGTLGNAKSLEDLSRDTVREHLHRQFRPNGAILAVAGALKWSQLRDTVHRLFGEWSGTPGSQIETTPPQGGTMHVQKDSAQMHIALAHRSVPVNHPSYYPARMAEAVLSAGMSSRLFTEIREKRGLVYHVSTRYHSLKDHAGMLTYAGTVPEKAQETFDVTVSELRRLVEGIDAEELARAKTQLKSSLVMQGESTGARAGALAADWYHLGRLRSLGEVQEAVDGVTATQVIDYLREFPAEDFTVLVIGPAPIDPGSQAG